MGKKNSLTCLEKRDLLNREAASVEDLLSWGEHYEESGLVHDAANFYMKASAREPLARLLESARADGDLFLFQRLCRALDHEPSQEEWISLGKRAEELGKHSFAAEAYRRGGVQDQTLQIGASPSS